MRNSRAPYEHVPKVVADARLARDRQNYRLIGRMWARLNDRDDAPIFSIWNSVQVRDPQLWLPLGRHGLDDWFVRAVNASIWDVSTQVGRNILDDLYQSFVPPPSVDDVRKWFQVHSPGRASSQTHECTHLCGLETYHLHRGFGKWCFIQSMPPEVETTFYATMTWLCGTEGRQFIARYRTALNRLYKFRRLDERNRRWINELRRGSP